MSRIEKPARASPGALLKTGLSRCQLEEFDDNDCMFANVSANDSFGDCAMASDAVPPRKMARATLSDLFMMQLLSELDGFGLRDMACSFTSAAVKKKVLVRTRWDVSAGIIGMRAKVPMLAIARCKMAFPTLRQA